MRDLLRSCFLLVALPGAAAGGSGFTLSATPANLTGCAGHTPHADVRVSASGAFGDPVTLSLVDPSFTVGPPEFSSNPVVPAPAPGASSDLGVPILITASPGVRALTLRGTAGNLVAELPMTVQVVAMPPPSPPTLVLPANDATAIALDTSFQWTGNGSSYRFLLSRRDDFQSPIEDQTTTANSVSAHAPLRANTRYYWRVIPSNACGPGAASTASFVTEAGDTIFSDGFHE